MIALKMVCSDENVTLGAIYLARVSEENYTIVHPISLSNSKGEEPYKECRYIGDDNVVYQWYELRELAQII